MHLVDDSESQPIASEAELVGYFHGAGKPAARWRVGSEHELIGVVAGGPELGAAPAYDGPAGIGALMAFFATRGWAPVREAAGGADAPIIALTRGDAQITLEPGGQFELAAAPVDDDRQFADDLAAHVATLAEASRELGLAWLATGVRPEGELASIPWMPKQRYAVMRAYMPGVGTRGLDMMQRTATVQTNLDYADEADAAAKMRGLMSVTSILTALWASSPIVGGVDTGRQSHRAWIWRDTDRARAGLLPLAFEGDDLFERYTAWALDVPMYFVYRGGYQPAGGITFRQFLRQGFRDHHATHADWALHLSTLFPEARLKRFIEVRGCDCGSLGMIAALGPMARGLLYDATALAEATALTAGLSAHERETLADVVPERGLATPVGRHTVGDLARELVAIAADGLGRIAPASRGLLAPVEAIATSGRTQADELRDAWHAAGDDRRARLRALAHPELAPTLG
ncbi:MAG: glutamate-cysteine ligase family protein [Kofleriaceae bacterium]